MGDSYDSYREALVVEKATIWPDEIAETDPAERAAIEEQLHANAQEAAELTYVRLHTGFSRQITVTSEDIQRLKRSGADT